MPLRHRQNAMRDVEPAVYWVALHSVPGLGPVTYRRLLEKFGNPQTVLLEASRRDLNSIKWLKQDLIKGIFKAKKMLRHFVSTVNQLTSKNVRVLTLADKAYPSKIRMIKNASVVLYSRGNCLKTNERAVAIVGSSRPSEKGYRIAADAAKILAQRGVAIISGYARGIDTAAHLGAMETFAASGAGHTIMAIPTGFDHFVWNKTLRPHAGNSGGYTIISESFPNQQWSVGTALSRNRLIAGLSDAVLVVETEVGGGAAHTFSHARALGRKTFALKYTNPPGSAMGNETLLSQGATPISSYKDLDKIAAYL
ncbi:MAG: DNA-protecting protein DprA [Candidatus Brocadiales bacterium]|nr:DNA-protecting protein DprA [Candidatus Bathyanammoxibius sp.]